LAKFDVFSSAIRSQQLDTTNATAIAKHTSKGMAHNDAASAVVHTAARELTQTIPAVVGERIRGGDEQLFAQGHRRCSRVASCDVLV